MSRSGSDKGVKGERGSRPDDGPADSDVDYRCLYLGKEGGGQEGGRAGEGGTHDGGQRYTGSTFVEYVRLSEKLSVKYSAFT